VKPSELKRDLVLPAAVKILHLMAEQSKTKIPSLPIILRSAVAAFDEISQHTLKK